jgi:hypothetical protein
MYSQEPIPKALLLAWVTTSQAQGWASAQAITSASAGSVVCNSGQASEVQTVVVWVCSSLCMVVCSCSPTRSGGAVDGSWRREETVLSNGLFSSSRSAWAMFAAKSRSL